MNFNILENDILRLELVISVNNSYYYKIYKDNTYIGNCGIRLSNDKDNYYLGNIEYEIFPQYRGKNYGEQASKLLMNIALYFNINDIYITANPDNLASIKTITNLGGKFIEVVKTPKKSRLYKKGDIFLARYKLNIESE